MKRIITFLFVLVSALTYAQQDALYSQYMFNQFAINPAYAGSRDALSAVMLYRNQWAGIDGAPVSQSVAIHSPFQDKNFAIGLNATNEKIGPVSTMGVFGTYAYHLPFENSKLSLGLRAGVFRSHLDGGMLDYRDKTDRFNNSSMTSALVPSFDFGAYYYTTKFYAGLAATHITQQRIGYEDIDNMQMRLSRHFMATVGKAFVINDDFVLKPSLFARYVDGAPVNMDVNMSCLFYKTIWVGASFRSSKDLVMITELNVTDYLRVGYSYDMTFNQLQKYSSGSHEIFLGFDFNISKRKVVSTRLL